MNIERKAILHIPTSQYAFAQAEHKITIRLRAAKGNLEKCTLYWGDRAYPASPVRFFPKEMQIRWTDAEYDFYEVTLEEIPERLCYYFRLQTGDEWSYYYADLFTKELPDYVLEDGFVVEGRSEYYQYPYILRTEILSIPEWFQNAVVYNIFPDSFASGKETLAKKAGQIYGEDGKIYRACLGGTLRGIMQNLDYIQNLGFNCLYLNPIFAAGEYHKYDIIDYMHIDPCFGSDEDFMQLTDEAHRRGMHVVIDGVFNHCSWESPFFEDVIAKGRQSHYWNWFYNLPDKVVRPRGQEGPEYACFAYEPKMPKLNTSNPEVQDYFAGVGRYWVEHFHVDGWRLDVANEIDKNFWRKFRTEVKAANPEAVLIGEVWENASVWLRGDMLDSAMNYDFRKYCRDFFARSVMGAKDFTDSMTDMLLRYPIQISYGQLNLLDSHDVARFYSLCNEDQKKWRLAFVYLMMAPGVPSVFYGDEKLIPGMREPEYRQAMPWSAEPDETLDFVKRIIQIRKQYVNPSDEWHILHASNESNLLVFERIGKNCVRICMNAGNEQADIASWECDGRMLLQSGKLGHMLEPKGYMVCLNTPDDIPL